MFFCFVEQFVFGQHKRYNIIFFPEFNIRFYDKNSESDYFFFPPPKSEYSFQQLNGRSLKSFCDKTWTRHICSFPDMVQVFIWDKTTWLV